MMTNAEILEEYNRQANWKPPAGSEALNQALCEGCMTARTAVKKAVKNPREGAISLSELSTKNAWHMTLAVSCGHNHFSRLLSSASRSAPLWKALLLAP